MTRADACQIEARARDLIELRAKIIAILGGGYEGPISHDEMVADRLMTLFADLAGERS